MIVQSVFTDAVGENGLSLWHPAYFHLGCVFQELVPEAIWYPRGHEHIALRMPSRNAVQFGISPFEFVRDLVQLDKLVYCIGWQASGCQVVATVCRGVRSDEGGVMGWQPFGEGLYATVDVGRNPFLKAVETAITTDTVLGNAEVVRDMVVAEWVALKVLRGVSIPFGLV